MNTASTKSKTLRVAVEGRNLEDLLPLLEQFPCTIVTEAPDLVITHGGDGSLLGAERKYPGIPKCPIRDRKRNPKCPRHDEITTLKHLFEGTLKVSHLTKLQVTTQAGESLTGINDIMLDRVDPTAAIRYRIWINGELIRPRVVADSLLLSTPFGSTGYFLSITRGTFSTGIGLAFNNPMDLFGHTVVPEDSTIRVQLLRGPALLVADNNPKQIPVNTDETLEISVLPEKTRLYGLDVFRCMDCFDLRKNGNF